MHNQIVKLPTTNHVILWDIGDTLLVVNNRKVIKEFGLFTLGAYYLSYLLHSSDKHSSFKNHLEQLFLNMLGNVPSPFGSPGYAGSSINKPVPPIQQDFLLGKLSGHEAMELIDRWINTHPHAFTNRYQRSIFRISCHLFFEHYEDMLTYGPLFKLFKAAYLATDAQGNRRNTNIILSNWERDIGRLKQNFPEIFSYSSAQIFSGVEDTTKPKLALFELAQKEIPNNPHVLWFLVDDQEINRLAAAKENIIPIAPDEAEMVFKQYELIN